MAKTGMLIITNPNKFNRIIPRLAGEIKNTLYVHLNPHKKNINNKISQTFTYSTSIIILYKKSLNIRQVDVRVLLGALRNPNSQKINTKRPIEVVYFDESINQDEIQGFMSSFILNKTDNCQAVSLSVSEDSLENINPNRSEMYNYVVLGGTFDRLHIAHKILLSEAILRCKKKLTVGVRTDLNMLKSKKLWELVEPCTLRINKVRDFLEEVEPTLEYDVVPINDMYGPTKDDPSFELIIVSAETMGGADKVNEVRLMNNLKPLKVHSVELIPDEKLDEEEEDKISSSNDRLRLLGTLISPPESKPHLPPLPYLIGLTGGIGSGKSSISSRLSGLGASIIDCDKIAHMLYKPGTPVYSKIIDLFGKDIKGENGEINRRKLGEIVFGNKEKLQQLNKLLWPSILEKSKEVAQELYSSGSKVVVLEAAVLIQAGWDAHVHEVWATIIPPAEALRRIKERNRLSDEEGAARISSQPSNMEYVAKANVVLSTLWRPEFSQKQVERAWTSLLQRLPSEKI